MTTPAMVLLLSDADRTAATRSALEDNGIVIEVASFPGPANDGLQSYQLVVVEAGEPAAEFVSRWRSAHSTTWRPILWLADDADGRTAGWQYGADACLSRPFGIGELTAQVTALLSRQEEHARLTAWANEAGRLNRSLSDVYRQCEFDASLARLIVRHQEANAPANVGRVQIFISQRFSGAATGDFHSIRELGDARIALLLADVMGHSVSATLLSTYVMQIIAGQPVSTPAATLAHVNEALLYLRAPDPPLVRATYAIVNGKTGEVNFVMAGHTAPLLVPVNGPPRFSPAAGAMLGLSQTRYDAQMLQLQSGDRLLLYTDGLIDETTSGPAKLAESASRFRELPLAAHLEAISQQRVESTTEPDEFTVIGIEMG